MGTQGNSIGLHGCHRAHCPLIVSTLNVGVIIWVVLWNDVFSTAWIQSSLDGISAVGFVLPSDNGRLSWRCLVFTLEGDGLEEDDNVPLGGALDWDSSGVLWGKKNKNKPCYWKFLSLILQVHSMWHKVNQTLFSISDIAGVLNRKCISAGYTVCFTWWWLRGFLSHEINENSRIQLNFFPLILLLL